MKFFFNPIPDNLILIPTVILTAGRCPDPECGEMHGVAIRISWLNVEAGIELPFWT